MKVSTYRNIKSCAEGAIKKFHENTCRSHRVSTRVWKYILLNNLDEFTEKGAINKSIKLKAKSMGAGVYEITVDDSED